MIVPIRITLKLKHGEDKDLIKQWSQFFTHYNLAIRAGFSGSPWALYICNTYDEFKEIIDWMKSAANRPVNLILEGISIEQYQDICINELYAVTIFLLKDNKIFGGNRHFRWNYCRFWPWEDGGNI